MTTQNRWHAGRATAAIAVTLLLASCTKTVQVEGSLPTPKVRQLPAEVGVYYSDAFRAFKHEERVPENGT